MEHWLDEGCVLSPKAEVPDPYRDRARALWVSDKFTQIEWDKRKKKGKSEAEQLGLW